MKSINGNKNNIVELKQEFLYNAISDISSYIKFTDTKISIILAALTAIISSTIPFLYQNFNHLIKDIIYNNIWLYIIIVALISMLISIISTFYFGIKTIFPHVSQIKLHSNWFIRENNKEYPLNIYLKDIHYMSAKDIIKQTAVELYKLNDINREKQHTSKSAIISFSITLILSFIILIILIFSYIGRGLL